MKMNKKGFTIVELVIVIAVIAILAGVMIPTFGGVIDSANKSAAQQEAVNVYKGMAGRVESAMMGTEFTDATFYIEVDDYLFIVEGGVVKDAPEGTTVESISETYESTVDFGSYDNATVYALKAE